jgi:Fic family protein
VNRQHLINGVRERLKRYPAPYDSHYGVVPLAPPENSVPLGSAQSAHRTAIEAIGRADALARAYPHHFLLSRVLVRQEAVTSSAIEGTYSTLDQLLEDEATFDPLDPDGEVRRTATKQVKNYAEALEGALASVERNRYDALSVGLIRDLQRQVVKDDPDYKHTPGDVRGPAHVVWIGGSGHIARSIYNPCPPGEVHACLTEHIAYLRCDGLQAVHQSMITRMALAHAHFEAIHPFPDGNGRVGRLLLPLMLAADGHAPLYITPHLAADRAAYMDGLKAAQQRLDYAPLIQVLSAAITAAVDRAETAHESLLALSSDWITRAKWRKNSAARRTLDMLSSFPVMTAKRLSASLSVTLKSANDGIKQLENAGIVRERTGFKRNRVFVAHEVLDIFNAPL